MWTFREMTSETLAQGWWSPLSVFIAPVTLVRNLIERTRLMGLAAPSGQVTGKRLVPGKPVWRRWAIAGPFVLIGLLSAVTWLAAPNGSELEDYVGRCVQEVGGVDEVQVVFCDTPHYGTVISVADTPNDCPDDTDSWVQWEAEAQSFGGTVDVADPRVLCVIED